MFAGVIPVCIFLAGLLVHATRRPVTRRQRLLVLVLAGLAFSGVAGQWMVIHSRTRWQHDELLEIRDRIERSTMISAMYDRATPVFAAFHRQRFPENRSMTEVFTEFHPAIDRAAAPVMLDSLDGGVKVFAKSAWHTVVVLTSVSGVGRGIDPEFKNIDGRYGFLQTSLRLIPEGMVYEIQN
jgi:hypothetical protein